MSRTEVQYAVAHVFVPALFPRLDSTPENDHFLARAVCAASHSFGETLDAPLNSQWHFIIKMLDNLQSSIGSWQDECLEKENIISQLQGSKPRDVLAFFNQAQDAAVIFRKLDRFTLCESFPTSLDSSSLCGSYPEWVVEIPNGMFDRRDFHLGLANFLLYPKKFLSHENPPEDATTIYTRLLTSILRSVGRSIEPSHIIKRFSSHLASGSRSSLWLLVKVAIQTSLDHGSLGRVCYKTFMLYFMCSLAKDAIDASLSSDGLHAILVKVLRRLRKVGASAPNWLNDMVLKTASSLREALEIRWKEIEMDQIPTPIWKPFQLDLHGDIQLLLMQSRKHICNSLMGRVQGLPSFPFHPGHRLQCTLNNFPRVSSNGSLFEEAYHADPYVALYDVEQAVEGGIDDWVARVTNAHSAWIQLAALMHSYLPKASEAYKNNPEHRSVMLLTMIDLWVAIDKLLLRVIPALATFSPEVPVELLGKPLLRKTLNLHRLRRAYQYLSARCSQCLPGRSLSSDASIQEMFPVHIHTSLNAIVSLSGYNIAEFKLRDQSPFNVWRFATSFILQFLPQTRSGNAAKVRRLLPSLHMYQTSPTTGLVCAPLGSDDFDRPWDILHMDLPDDWIGHDEEFVYQLHSSPGLHLYVKTTSHTPNDVLTAEMPAERPIDLSPHELMAFGHLRSGGSVQWVNILRELHGRTLNLRHHDIYFLLAQATSEVGLLDLKTEEWVWHQELQEPLFPNALLDELECLFLDVAVQSFDAVMMANISFLLTRLLASPCHEEISDRAIRLLRKVRSTTFQWVQEFSYNLMMAPMNTERSDLLRDMSAACRSTFDVGADVIHRLLCSAEDIDTLLSCAIFIHANTPSDSEGISEYSSLILERDRRLSLALEGVLRDVILAQESDRGIDLAIRRVWYGYRPGPHRWEPMPCPSSQRWLTCKTAPTGNRTSQVMHLNLLDGTLLVDGKPIDGLPLEVRQKSTYKRIFGNQRFLTIASDLPGMDLSSLALISEHRVYFSLQHGKLVIRAQHKNSSDILEMIPQEELELDLPKPFVHGYLHWLNLSTSIIEIRPIEKLWEESIDNWRIDCASGQYRMFRGRECLVDIKSRTWEMVSLRLGCLDVAENLIITAYPVDPPQSKSILRLSVVLPRYNLSFFVNEDGDLQSRDFKGMVFDENQCIGSLFGLENKLVLRSNMQVEDELVHRFIIIPDGPLTREQRGRHVLIKINTCDLSASSVSESLSTMKAHLNPGPVTYHTFKVDTDLGCLTGYVSWRSKLYLAHLHAETSVDWLPDPLTGRTGIQEALHLLRSAGCRSIIELDVRHEKPDILSRIDWMYPQIDLAIKEINYLIERERFLRTNQNCTSGPPERPTLDVIGARRTAYLFPSDSEVAGRSMPVQTAFKHQKFSGQDGIAYILSLVSYHLHLETWNGANSQCDTELECVLFPSSAWTTPDIFLPWVTEADALLQEAVESCQCLRLMFLLPTILCRQKDPRPHLISIFAALARRYRPSWEVSLDCFANMQHSALTSEDMDSAMHQLFTAWKWLSETAPAVPLFTTDIEELTSDFKRLFPGDRHRNLELNTRSQVHASRQIFDHQSPHVRVPWQITLSDLLRDRRAPKLPDLTSSNWTSIKENVRSSYLDTQKLNQVFASLRIDTSFQRQYISRLHSSARHVRETSRMTYGVVRRPATEELRKYYVQCRGDYEAGLASLKGALGPMDDPVGQALDQSGQWPEVIPVALFQCLASTSKIKPPDGWKNCLVSLALLLLRLQRARRLLQFSLSNLEEELYRELENEGCDGWNAEMYTDWLLIQLQGNFLIRGIQADVAMKMISPPSGENTAMQVDMGEGKSSVILPISAATLANSNKLCRVILPKALSVQMFRLLVDRLGGLANRTIYHLPFSRFLTSRYGYQQFEILRELLSECLRDRGILVVQPEHLLSLKLTVVQMQLPSDPSNHHNDPDYDDSGAGIRHFNSDSGDLDGNSNHNSNLDTPLNGFDGAPSADHLIPSHASLELQEWFHSYARDILDESDDVLNPRFHLMYTSGRERFMQGYPDRWIITQQVLRLARKHALSLSHDLPNAIEYELASSGSFPRIRILRASDVCQRLTSMIVDDVMGGHLSSFSFRDINHDRQLCTAVRAFISSRDVLQQTANMVEEYARQTVLWDRILLLRGLLACNILSFALGERRWRVDYGLDTKRSMLAVPYRAKDVPAPTAEFGHPDLTIVLTCLSYYYGGLTEEQLRVSFEILQEQDDPSTEYANWILDYDPGSLPHSVQDLGNINPKSSEQWDRFLFPLFARNQGAVDFYLSRVVFPDSLKEFPWKLVASSWDLAEIRKHPVTGFSGTNDYRDLLPIPITQRDLDHQRGANARILSHLLQSENDSYILISHARGERRTTSELLAMIVDQEPGIRVILDVGAQILDLCNHDVVKAWLALSPGSDGAIYFNEDDELMVLTKDGTKRSLLSSPFAQQLERCVVYLDDAHTRGTDLNFPSGFRAAVTLGPKVTKDRLVQGCMRMRKLGRGHSVMFFAPLEVDQSIRAVAEIEDQTHCITTTDILRWAIHETWTDIQRWAPYWAKQGISHHTRYDAWTRFCSGEFTREQLAVAWLQPEHKSLADLYAPFQSQDDPPNFSAILGDHPGIQQHCMDLGVLKLPDAEMEEEQEREVNREIERERVVELWPATARPAEHLIHPDVVAFVRTGKFSPTSSAFHPVSAALEGSSAAATAANFWSPFLLATADFCKTIEPKSWQGLMDEYLRPVHWVLSGRLNNDRVLVLLSPFEADSMVHDIKASTYVHLHAYTPRTSENMRPIEDLTFYSIPPVPDNWTPPWDLIDQLNVFAGQLYFSDYESYLRLRHFLGIDKWDPPKNVGRAIRHNKVNRGVLKEIGKTFNGSPLPSVMMLLVIRRKGQPFAETHMGRVLQGQVLTEKDFESAWEKPGRNSTMLPGSSKRERETVNPPRVDGSAGRLHKRMREDDQ